MKTLKVEESRFEWKLREAFEIQQLKVTCSLHAVKMIVMTRWSVCDDEILQTHLLILSGEKATWRLTSSPDVNFQYVVFLNFCILYLKKTYTSLDLNISLSLTFPDFFSVFFTTDLLLFRMFQLSFEQDFFLSLHNYYFLSNSSYFLFI